MAMHEIMHSSDGFTKSQYILQLKKLQPKHHGYLFALLNDKILLTLSWRTKEITMRNRMCLNPTKWHLKHIQSLARSKNNKSFAGNM